MQQYQRSSSAKKRIIQPSVNKAIKKILSKEIVVAIVDTKGLGKPDIEKLEPFITDSKVSTEETIHLK